jgi:hypothetical protein
VLHIPCDTPMFVVANGCIGEGAVPRLVLCLGLCLGPCLGMVGLCARGSCLTTSDGWRYVRWVACHRNTRGVCLIWVSAPAVCAGWIRWMCRYETFRTYKEQFYQPGKVDLLICDEAHRLKNDATQTSVSRTARHVLVPPGSSVPFPDFLRATLASLC